MVYIHFISKCYELCIYKNYLIIVIEQKCGQTLDRVRVRMVVNY